MIACATFYYRVGNFEYDNGFLLAFISVALSIITIVVLGWGRSATIGAQAGIFAILTIINMFRKPGFK